MRKHCLSAFAAAMVLATSTASVAAASPTDHFSDSRIIPVLVHVDKTGHITEMQPAYDLRPVVEHAVQQTITGMITKPATKNGKATSSEFVMFLALKPLEGSTNQYQFAFVSTQPVPVGNWHWVHATSSNGKKLQLVRAGSVFNNTRTSLPCGNEHTKFCIDPSGEPRAYLAF